MARLLTKENIQDIRSSYEYHTKGHTMKEIAQRYNVAYQTIEKILKRQTYKNI